MHGAGVRAMGKLMDPRHGPASTAAGAPRHRGRRRRELLRVAPLLARWTGGRSWEELNGLPWDEVQNTPRQRPRAVELPDPRLPAEQGGRPDEVLLSPTPQDFRRSRLRLRPGELLAGARPPARRPLMPTRRTTSASYDGRMLVSQGHRLTGRVADKEKKYTPTRKRRPAAVRGGAGVLPPGGARPADDGRLRRLLLRPREGRRPVTVDEVIDFLRGLRPSTAASPSTTSSSATSRRADAALPGIDVVPEEWREPATDHPWSWPRRFPPASRVEEVQVRADRAARAGLESALVCGVRRAPAGDGLTARSAWGGHGWR